MKLFKFWLFWKSQLKKILAEHLFPLILMEKSLGVALLSSFSSKHLMNTESVLQWSDGCKWSHTPKPKKVYLDDITVRIYIA